MTHFKFMSVDPKWDESKTRFLTTVTSKFTFLFSKRTDYSTPLSSNHLATLLSPASTNDFAICFMEKIVRQELSLVLLACCLLPPSLGVQQTCPSYGNPCNSRNGAPVVVCSFPSYFLGIYTSLSIIHLKNKKLLVTYILPLHCSAHLQNKLQTVTCVYSLDFFTLHFLSNLFHLMFNSTFHWNGS